MSFQKPYLLDDQSRDPDCELDLIVLILMPGDEVPTRKIIVDAAVKWADSHGNANIAESVHLRYILVVPISDPELCCEEYLQANLRACVRVGSKSFPVEKTGGDLFDYGCVDCLIS